MAETLELTRFRDSTAQIEDPVALRDRARRDGYVWLRGVVPADKLAALRRRVMENCSRRGWIAAADVPSGDRAGGVPARPALKLGASDDPRYLQFLSDVVPSREFVALGDDRSIRDIMSVLCGAPAVRRHADICRVTSPDTQLHTTRPHQDHQYLGGADPGWAVWIPLVDCPLSLGPLAVQRGSHLLGPRPHRKDGIIQYVPDTALAGGWDSGDLAAGDAVFFHGCAVHRALPNRSGGHLRLSVDYRFLSGG